MAKKELKIDTYKSETGGTIFVLSQNVKGMNSYQLAKAIHNFINRETNVLEMAIENHLRQILRENGVLPSDGSKSALERAFATLEVNGKTIKMYDRYNNGAKNEKIVGVSADETLTVIMEDNYLSCAMEVEVMDCGQKLRNTRLV